MIELRLDDQATGLGYFMFDPEHVDEMTDQLYALMMGWA